jgi:hypothetical protein
MSLEIAEAVLTTRTRLAQEHCPACNTFRAASGACRCTVRREQALLAKRRYYHRTLRPRTLAAREAPGPNQVYCCGMRPHPVTLDHAIDGTPLLRLPCCGRVFRLTRSSEEALCL